MKLKILTQGKVKEAWLQQALDEYTKRLIPYVSIEWALFKSDEELEKALFLEKNLILLDPQGKLVDSPEFSRLLLGQFTKGGASLSLGIGGPDGFSEKCKEKRLLLSLSPLTFTHQMVRLLLLEQIYRAFQIEKKSPYHR